MNITTSLFSRKPNATEAQKSDSFKEEILRGLLSTPKTIASKFFYDDRGSRLFERITELPEYYPTRTESQIMRENIADITRIIGSGVQLVEFGSGNGEKVRFLLDHLESPVRYIPIDISQKILLESAERLSREYPALDVEPVVADYTTNITVPLSTRESSRTVVFFPGSTIGNFEPEEGLEFLKRMNVLAGRSGGLLIGVDLKKDVRTLHRAYNDSLGVTAAFNLNLIRRIKYEFGAEIDERDFEHHAFYNEREGRIEMHLVSERDQQVCLGGTSVSFAKGEHTITEYSYKYTIEEFASLAAKAGFHLQHTWTDSEQLFGVFYFAT